MRRRRVILGVGLGVLLVALMAGAVFANRASIGCFLHGLPPGPATHTSGSIVITTDASVYAPGDPIKVTITSQLLTSIYLFTDITFQESNCHGYALQRRDGTNWREADMVQCNNTGDTVQRFTGLPNLLTPGDTYPTLIGLGANLAPGTYRYVPKYMLADPNKPNLLMEPYRSSVYWPSLWSAAMPMYSQPFQICSCASCS